LLLRLLGNVGGIEGLVGLVGLSSCLFGGLLFSRFRLHHGSGLGHVVGIAVDDGLVARVVALEDEEQGENGERKHECLLEGEHRGRRWPEPVMERSGRRRRTTEGDGSREGEREGGRREDARRPVRSVARVEEWFCVGWPAREL